MTSHGGSEAPPAPPPGPSGFSVPSPKSKTDAMFGWCSEAALRASVAKRLRKVGSPASSFFSSFTATARSSRVSVACHTSPMPPVATGSSSR